MNTNSKIKSHPLEKAASVSRGVATAIIFFGFIMGLAISIFGIPLNISVYGASHSGYIPYVIAIIVGILSLILYPIIQKKKNPQIKSNFYTWGKINTHIGLLTLIAVGAGFVFVMWAYIVLFIKTSDNTSINEFLYYPDFATKVAFVPIVVSVYLSSLKKFISQSINAREIILIVISTIALIFTIILISFINFGNTHSTTWWSIFFDLIAGGSSYTFAIYFLLKFKPVEKKYSKKINNPNNQSS